MCMSRAFPIVIGNARMTPLLSPARLDATLIPKPSSTTSTSPPQLFPSYSSLFLLPQAFYPARPNLINHSRILRLEKYNRTFRLLPFA